MQIDRATELRDLKLYGALRHHYDRFGTGAKIGSVRLPNFKENNEGYTKTEPTRSDEEILKDVAELAKKHAEKGTFHNADNEYLDLWKEYISSASPDRESILTKSLKQIFGKTNVPKEDKKASTDSILQQTLKMMENTKNKNGIINNNKTTSSAMYKIGWMEGNELKYADFYDSNGECIANYTQSGWDLYTTKAEKARSDEIVAVYNEAFNSVYNAPPPSMPKHLEGGTTIDLVG